MQTFLPYANFHKSARHLDYRRLGKQRVETKQLLSAIRDGTGWSNHPCTKMWTGYEHALMSYGNAMISEWIKRGYKNTMPFWEVPDQFEVPGFVGREDFHASHRAALLAKDFDHYSRFGWSEEPAIEYQWA